ncbi:MAG: cytochrome c [Candidatus Acidiferrales bacterium]
MSVERRPSIGIFALASLAFLLGRVTAAQQPGGNVGVQESAQQKLLDEGEKRFHANCGRCHQSPHKFPPRMVMTIERHMRVRATRTDEDMRAIVAYLTQ